MDEGRGVGTTEATFDSVAVPFIPRAVSRSRHGNGHRSAAHLQTRPDTKPTWRAKRFLDIVAALVGLILLSPLLLVAALGVKLSSRGAILFRQPRIGRDGSHFTMYKFRTFPVDHVDNKFSLEHHECPLVWGRFLRRTSIDELPQLLNVLLGQMSLVGPRPERPHFAVPLAESIPDYEARHRVPGGITGAAQIAGLWGNSSIEERVWLDNRYIDEWSFRTDLAILVRTPTAILRKSRGSNGCD